MSTIASCSTEAITQPKSEFRLIPAGLFRAWDGRPAELPGWTLDADSARKIVAEAKLRQSDYVIDYEHQTLSAKNSGQPAPAAGWFKRLEWREGDGIYVIGARWTDAAARMITAQQYRYISPVFVFNEASGQVLGIRCAGLTNIPALDGLTDLMAASLQLSGGALKGAALNAPGAIAQAAQILQRNGAQSGRYLTTVEAVRSVLGALAKVNESQSIAEAALAYQQREANQGRYVSTQMAVFYITNGGA